MKRVTQFELRNIEKSQVGNKKDVDYVQVHVLRIPTGEKVEECLCIAGIRLGSGGVESLQPKGLICNGERQDGKIKTWTRLDFIYNTMLKAIDQRITISMLVTNVGASHDQGLVETFIAEFQLDDPDLGPGDELRAELLSAIVEKGKSG